MRSRETEIKIRIADVPATRERLRELKFHLVHRRSLEDNLLFDTPDRALRRIRSILRLRRYGRRWSLTYKGTPAADRQYKSRLELETHVDQPRTFGLIFQALGFHPVFRYQKYRTQYAPPASGRAHCEVALDETPVGNFLELEGSRAWIDRVARDLGYSRADYSTASYGALYLDQCRQANVKPGDMVFDTASGRANFLLREKTGKTS